MRPRPDGEYIETVGRIFAFYDARSRQRALSDTESRTLARCMALIDDIERSLARCAS